MPPALTIHLIYDMNSEAHRARVQALEAWLTSVRTLVSAFSKPQHFDLRQPLGHADINVHVEIPVVGAVPWAHANVLLKNPDKWSEDWSSSLWAFNTVVTVGELTAEGLEALFQAAMSRRPTKGVFHCPPILQVEDCPPISIVTPTYNRAKLIEIAFHNILSTDYPKDRIEWILIEDSDPDTVVPAAKEAILKFQISNPTLADQIAKFRYTAPQSFTDTPKAKRLHACNDNPSFGDQNALNFTQGGVRVKTQLQGVGQNDQIQTGIWKWQGFVIAKKQGPLQTIIAWQAVTCHEFVRHTVRTQSVALGQTQLQRMKSKSIRHRAVKILLFPRQHVLPRRGLEPFVQTIGF